MRMLYDNMFNLHFYRLYYICACACMCMSTRIEPKKAPPHNPLSNYIELKTSRVISSAREQNSFER